MDSHGLGLFFGAIFLLALVGQSLTGLAVYNQKAGGITLWLYSNSLLLVMGLIFLASWYAQSVAGVVTYNVEQLRNLQDPVSWAGYVASADFWNRTLQNWQSEFLAVGSMVVLDLSPPARFPRVEARWGAPHHDGDRGLTPAYTRDFPRGQELSRHAADSGL